MNEDTVEGGPSQQEEILQTKAKLDKLLRHIRNVQEACELLGKKLIEKAENHADIDFGVRLIALGQIHDFSKYSGIEWDYLTIHPSNSNGALVLAITHHQRTNKHHVEFWGEINLMPKIYLAELVCDVYCRATEFGTDVREYIKDKLMSKYDISPQGKVYKYIKEFLDLLLEKPFETLDVR